MSGGKMMSRYDAALLSMQTKYASIKVSVGPGAGVYMNGKFDFMLRNSADRIRLGRFISKLQHILKYSEQKYGTD